MLLPVARYPPSVMRMIVLPGVRRSGVNAAGASARGRTAPTIGLSRPSLSLSACQVQEGVYSRTQGGVAVRGPARADHYGSHLAGELHGDRTDTAGGAVDQDGLACPAGTVRRRRVHAPILANQ